MAYFANEDDLAMEGNLQNLIDNTSLRWIFVGGKGGVGKTTTSCSIASQLAKHRESVLLISTDPAHNLSDAFGQKFSSKPTLAPGFNNLYAMEIDPSSNLENESGGEDTKSFLTEIAASLPGVDEAMSFAELMKQVQSYSHSVIVFDTAPTGHTLRLLSFPTVLEKAFEKLTGNFSGIVDQVSGLISGAAGGNNGENGGFLSKINDIRNNVKQINNLFQDPNATTFVCVCIPEFLSLFETERLIQELTKYGIDSQNIVVNQVLMVEKGSNCGKCNARVKMQTKYLDQIDALYQDFHVVKMPLLDQEVRGKDSLLKFGSMLVSGIPDPLALTDPDDERVKNRC